MKIIKKDAFKIGCLLLLALLFNSCATFHKKYAVGQPIRLTSQNLNTLNGRYETVAIKSLRTKYRSNQIEVKEQDTLNGFNVFGYFKEIDSVTRKNTKNEPDAYFIRISTNEPKHLLFELEYHQQKIDSIRIPYQIKNNGYVYLKMKSLKINNIPLIYGGFELDRYRLGLNKDGDLMLDNSYYIYGAALIIIGDDRKQKTSNLYKKNRLNQSFKIPN